MQSTPSARYEDLLIVPANGTELEWIASLWRSADRDARYEQGASAIVITEAGVEAGRIKVTTVPRPATVAGKVVVGDVPYDLAKYARRVHPILYRGDRPAWALSVEEMVAAGARLGSYAVVDLREADRRIADPSTLTISAWLGQVAG